MIKSFKQFVRESEKPLGIFVNTACPEMVEIAAQTGFQFVFIDNEHGSWGAEPNSHLIRAAESFGCIPLVRVPNPAAEHDIKRALDCGCAGVVVPEISTPEDAKLALKYAMFYPQGERGACPYVRANQYTGKSEHYFLDSNHDVTVVMLIEGAKGVANFDAILDVNGVDCVFFGPYDLSVSLGIPGQVNNEMVFGAIKRMIDKAKAKNVLCGMLGVHAEDSNQWFDCGVDYVVAVGDMALYYQACEAMVNGIKK